MEMDHTQILFNCAILHISFRCLFLVVICVVYLPSVVRLNKHKRKHKHKRLASRYFSHLPEYIVGQIHIQVFCGKSVEVERVKHPWNRLINNGFILFSFVIKALFYF